jgi:hypothetical protein
MNRAQLVAEIESYGMEVIGNIYDLRDTVKLGRQICLDFPQKKVVKVFVMECEEYVLFGIYQNKEEAERAIDVEVKNECLNCDCPPDDEDYEGIYKDFRDAFKIEIEF